MKYTVLILLMAASAAAASAQTPVKPASAEATAAKPATAAAAAPSRPSNLQPRPPLLNLPQRLQRAPLHRQSLPLRPPSPRQPPPNLPPLPKNPRRPQQASSCPRSASGQGHPEVRLLPALPGRPHRQRRRGRTEQDVQGSLHRLAWGQRARRRRAQVRLFLRPPRTAAQRQGRQAGAERGRQAGAARSATHAFSSRFWPPDSGLRPGL